MGDGALPQHRRECVRSRVAQPVAAEVQPADLRLRQRKDKRLLATLHACKRIPQEDEERPATPIVENIDSTLATFYRSAAEGQELPP